MPAGAPLPAIFLIHARAPSGHGGALVPWLIIFPLVTGFLYAVSSIFLKRAMADGASPWRVTFACNMVMMVLYQPCWLARTEPFRWDGAAMAALAACTFFAGQIFTFLALSSADVSVATPLFGTKVIFVAGFTMLLLRGTISPHLWLAVALTVAGTVLISFQPKVHPRRAALSVGAGLATACSFGCTDVLVQKYAPVWGFGSFVPTMFTLVGVFSFGFLPFLRGVEWKGARWLWPGAILLAVQALGMAYTLSTFGHATTVNITYNTRGLWSIVLIWTMGHWVGNLERQQGGRVMLRRLAGAVLLVAAIFLATA